MTTTPTPEQIAELMAAGYSVLESKSAATPRWSVWIEPRCLLSMYNSCEWAAWSAAWSHYTAQRKS